MDPRGGWQCTLLERVRNWGLGESVPREVAHSNFWVISIAFQNISLANFRDLKRAFELLSFISGGIKALVILEFSGVPLAPEGTRLPLHERNAVHTLLAVIRVSFPVLPEIRSV